MKILIIAATDIELSGIKSKLANFDKDVSIDFKVTGIGSLQTCYHLLHTLNQIKYDFILQIGIAGSFDETIPIGSLCNVYAERLGDLGSENFDGSLLDAFELGLMENNTFPFINGYILNDFQLINENIYLVKACTVNKTSGSTQSIDRFKAKYPDCQVESMEGAALFYVCKNAHIAFMELRAISNIVEARNRDKWNIKLALSTLEDNIQDVLIGIIQQYQ